MSVIFILIGISLLVATCFLGAFLWATKSGQFEDDYTPSVRMLFDDAMPDPITSARIKDKSTKGAVKTAHSINENSSVNDSTSAKKEKFDS